MRPLSCAACSLAGAAAITLTIGCGAPKVSLSTGMREYVATDYSQVLEHWTRSEQLVDISELDDLLTVTATFESWDFRWAYVIRYARDYRLTVEQRRLLLTRTLDETKTRHQFYVALYGNTNRRWTDLTRPNSAWIVRLIDDQGNETAPSTIELIVKPGALERTYFPYTTVWRQAFRIQFPVALEGRQTIAADAKWFGLRFAGAEGNRELHWDLEPTDKRTASGGDRAIGAYADALIAAPETTRTISTGAPTSPGTAAIATATVGATSASGAGQQLEE